MKRVTGRWSPVIALVALLCCAGSPQVVRAQYADEELTALNNEIADLSAMFPAFTPYPWQEKEDETAFLYGDTKGIVHHVVSDGGRLHEKWRSFPLEGSVKEVFAEDLDGDGGPEIVVYTTGARIYVWETDEYELLWESVEENFEIVQAMVIADVDRDTPLEMVVAADNKILYYDGVEFFREREGRDFVEPSYMLIADVDGDQTKEIITNDGYVIDTNTLNIEWATDGFGYPISLFDLDNDGVLELVGEIGGALTFWDVKDRREIW
jgi:hypothetical protein